MKKRKGFTLVELLIVSSIIAITAGLGIASTKDSLSAKDKSNVLTSAKKIKVMLKTLIIPKFTSAEIASAWTTGGFVTSSTGFYPVTIGSTIFNLPLGDHRTQIALNSYAMGTDTCYAVYIKNPALNVGNQNANNYLAYDTCTDSDPVLVSY